MIEQIYINDRMEMVFSLGDACDLARDNLSSELADLLRNNICTLEFRVDQAGQDYDEMCDMLEKAIEL